MRNFLNGGRRSLGLIFIAALLLCASSALAQQDAPKNTLKIADEETLLDEAGKKQTNNAAAGGAFDEKNELSVWGGFAPDLPKFLGSSRDSTFAQLSVRYSRRLATAGSVALKYQVDFTPVAVINYDRRPVIQTGPNSFVEQSNGETVYGIGLNPVALQLNFRRRSNIQPFVGMHAGMIYFAKSIPDDRSVVFPDRFGTRLNFATAAGGGVDFVTDSGRAFTIGYKFQHISNATRGNINPGFDQNLFYIGYTFKKW
jgi:hypothetical protein